MVAVMEDVSERREAQKQLLQSERLAAIGQMVTGLAHESRNALQRAQACLDMLALDLEEAPDQLELTAKARRLWTIFTGCTRKFVTMQRQSIWIAGQQISHESGGIPGGILKPRELAGTSS